MKALVIDDSRTMRRIVSSVLSDLYGAPYYLGALLMVACWLLFRRTDATEPAPATS